MMKGSWLLILTMLLTHVAVCQTTMRTVSSDDTVSVHQMRGTYYSDRFVGRKTSSGEVFTQDKYTAAHHTYKFGTLLLVTNTSNGKQVIVRVNDRCPKNKVLDMTRKAARQIGIGSSLVDVQVLPSRFHFLWESQDEILDILKDGGFHDFVSNLDKNDMQGRYNVELLACHSLKEAKKLVAKLPLYHQDAVSYKPCDSSGKHLVFLDLSAKYTKALSVKLELNELFPDSRIIPAN